MLVTLRAAVLSGLAITWLQQHRLVDDYDVSLYEVIWPRRPAAFPPP
jgi:hypothetical protein